MGNKAADQTVMSCQCRSRYTHPFMAEYMTLSCQCHSRYTHPFMAEYLTLSCRTSGEGCKKSSNACHGPTRMHRNAQVGESVVTSLINDCYVDITQHKLVYRKILLNLRTLPQKEILVTMCAILKQFLD